MENQYGAGKRQCQLCAWTAAQAEITRAGAGNYPAQTLLDSYRTRLPQLDATLYPFPPQTPSTGDGASGDRGVSDPSRHGRQCGPLDAESGLERLTVSLPRGSRHLAG